MNILRGMDRFSWKAYETEVRRLGYGIHIQQDDEGKVYGYSVMRGNSRYKASELGKGRNLTTWEKRFEYDVEYVDNLSFLLDVKIVLVTGRCVLSRKGISAEGSATMEAFKGTAKVALHE